MNSASSTADFLRRLRRRARGTLLVWAAVTELVALALTGAARLGWTSRGEGIAWVAMATTVLLLGAWFWRVRGLTSLRLARELDARWHLQSRLETALELAPRDSALAEAQRREAAAKVAGREPPGGVPWKAGLLLLAAMFCLLGFEGAVFAWNSLTAHPTALATAGSPAATPSPAPPAAQAPSRSSIVWKSPDAEIKATAIEEVPLSAYAESDEGFRLVSLVYSVNGGSEVSAPLDAAALGDSAKPGGHALTPSLYLDELKLKPFDIVAYHLTGELNGSGPGRSVTSPPQFIQIRQPQADMKAAGGGDGRLIGMIFALKGQQLQLIKENFVLIHSPGGRADPGWNPENQRVAADQTGLVAMADDTRKLAASNDAPGAMLGYLEQAAAAMKEAGREIGQEANESALARQNRALALLVECEKFFGRAAGGQAPPAADPFKDEQAFTLPPRPATPAGQLEELAQRQQQNNAAPGGGDAGEQDAIAKGAQTLGDAMKLDPAAEKFLPAATVAAADAARQLALNDRSAARVPAAAAQRDLEEAVAAQESAGRAGAVADLDRIRRLLNAASRIAPAAARKEALVAAAGALRAAAAQQQQTGSAEAARQLAELASALEAPKAADKRDPKAASEPYSVAEAHDVAMAAARTQVTLMSRAVSLNRSIRQLNLLGKKMLSASSGAPAADTLGSMELASQEAAWVTDDSATIELAAQVAARADSLQKSGAPDGAGLRDAGDSAVKLAAILERSRLAGPRDQIARRFKPDDIDPAYRAAVEFYFEHLSRDAGTRRTASPP